jgi:hypothetical protein
LKKFKKRNGEAFKRIRERCDALVLDKQLLSLGPPASSREAFLARQFIVDERSFEQNAFDVVAGMVMPTACLIADPLGVFATYRAHAFGLSGFAMAALAVWLLRCVPSGFLAGVCAGASLFALLTGLVMLPVSLACLVIVIGFLGFVPFVSAFTYVRCASRALRLALQRHDKRRVLATFVLGSAVFLAVPVYLQWTGEGMWSPFGEVD